MVVLCDYINSVFEFLLWETVIDSRAFLLSNNNIAHFHFALLNQTQGCSFCESPDLFGF